jgi:ferrochelatase
LFLLRKNLHDIASDASEGKGQVPAVKRIAVLLVAHGEAETAGFLENCRVSMHTLRHASKVMPIPPYLQAFISINSSLRKKIRRDLAFEGSPHNRITRKLAAVLQEHLDEHDPDADCTFDVMAAFSASVPYVENTIESTREYDGQIIVSLSPVENSLTCGLLCEYLSAAYRPEELQRVKVISGLWRDDDLCRLYVGHLFGNCADFSDHPKENNTLILLFHGTLVRDGSGKSPGFRTGAEETARFAGKLTSAVMSDLRNPFGSVMTAYLNHDVGGVWSKPSFEEVCSSLFPEGRGMTALFAAGYFADGNETIHRSLEFSRSNPARQVRAIPCLNAGRSFARFLAGRVKAASRQIML